MDDFYWRYFQVKALNGFYQAFQKQITINNGDIYFPEDLKKKLYINLLNFQIYRKLDYHKMSYDIFLDSKQSTQLILSETSRKIIIKCFPDERIRIEVGVDMASILKVTTKTLLSYANVDNIEQLDPKKNYHSHYFHQTIGEFINNYRILIDSIISSLSKFSQKRITKEFVFPNSSETKNSSYAFLNSEEFIFPRYSHILILSIPVEKQWTYDLKDLGDVEPDNFFYFAKIYKYFESLGNVLSIVPVSFYDNKVKVSFANLGDEMIIKEVFAVSKKQPEFILKMNTIHNQYYLIRENCSPSELLFTNESADKIDLKNFPRVVNSPMSKFTTFLSTLIWGIADEVNNLIIDADLTLKPDNINDTYKKIKSFLNKAEIHQLSSSLPLSWRGFLRLQDALIGKNPKFPETTSIIDRLVTRGEKSVIIQIVGPHRTNIPILKKKFPKKSNQCPKFFADPEKREEIAKLFAVSAQVAVKSGASGIDINCGCPVNYINRLGGGATIMNYIELVEQILIETKAAIGSKIPIGIKIRNHPNIVEFVNRCLLKGISWVVVHPNTKEQSYNYYTLSDEALKTCKKIIDKYNEANNTTVRLIINGGILSIKDIEDKLDMIGDAKVPVMVARALRGNPFFLSNALNSLNAQKEKKEFSPLAIAIIGILHLRYISEYEGVLNLPVLIRFAQEYFRTFLDLNNVHETLLIETRLLDANNIEYIEKLLIEVAINKMKKC